MGIPSIDLNYAHRKFQTTIDIIHLTACNGALKMTRTSIITLNFNLFEIYYEKLFFSQIIHLQNYGISIWIIFKLKKFAFICVMNILSFDGGIFLLWKMLLFCSNFIARQFYICNKYRNKNSNKNRNIDIKNYYA